MNDEPGDVRRGSASPTTTKQSSSQLRWQGLLSDEVARHSRGNIDPNADLGKKILVEPMMRKLGIDWDHTKSTSFAKYMTFEDMLHGTNYPMPVGLENPQYHVGCVPTAIGQTMYYLIKYRYGLDDSAIESNSMDDETFIYLQYITNTQLGGREVGADFYNVKRLNSNYSWSEMPDEPLSTTNSVKAATYASPLLTWNPVNLYLCTIKPCNI